MPQILTTDHCMKTRDLALFVVILIDLPLIVDRLKFASISPRFHWGQENCI